MNHFASLSIRMNTLIAMRSYTGNISKFYMNSTQTLFNKILKQKNLIYNNERTLNIQQITGIFFFFQTIPALI